MSPESHKRVLVVDDDDNTRHLLVSLLRQRGLTVDEAEDGGQAIDLLLLNEYAVVLLDLLMPRADGFAVLDAIKSDDVKSAPVMLVVTGADRKIVDRLDSQRIHGIVRKPFDSQELVSLVVACVDIRGRGTLETMAMAMISSAPLLVWLHRL
jgi:CheY-like chemotaxis protein